jgi:predicted metalloprotease with PDZ domain
MLQKILIVCALATSASPAAAQRQLIEYEIAFPKAEQHEANVIATFRGVPSGELRAAMARSSPGRYANTSFAKNVYDVRATDGRGRPLAVTRPDPHTWSVRGHDGTVRISYTVWGDRTDGTYLGIDHSHAHLNMPATFMYPKGVASGPIRLKIQLRAGWRVATQLAPTADSMTFTAPNLQYFLDSPTEIGPVTIRTWTSTLGNKTSTYRVAVHHLGTEPQVDSFATLVKRVVAEAEAMWGEQPGYDLGTYTFIADYLPWVNGDGMEHRNSTVLTSRGTLADSASRVNRLGAVSHEVFHAWSMERLRARALEPFDFDRENMSRELWFGEGFTNYYGPLIIRRAGLSTDADFANEMGGAIAEVINGPGREHFSAAEMSLLAPFVDGAVWLDPTNRQNTFISYYTGGQVIGLALDLLLRQRYNTTLDEYMRVLWRDFGRHQSAAFAPTRPYTTADLRITLGRVAKDTAFANDFFRRYIEGREAPDFGPLLAQAGFLIPKDTVIRPYLGASMGPDSTGVFINWTSANGSMYLAGISGGDIVHSIDGIRVTSVDSLNSVVRARKPGDVVQVALTQRGDRRTLPMKLISLPTVRMISYESAGIAVTDAIRRFRSEWLGSKVRNAR